MSSPKQVLQSANYKREADFFFVVLKVETLLVQLFWIAYMFSADAFGIRLELKYVVLMLCFGIGVNSFCYYATKQNKLEIAVKLFCFKNFVSNILNAAYNPVFLYYLVSTNMLIDVFFGSRAFKEIIKYTYIGVLFVIILSVFRGKGPEDFMMSFTFVSFAFVLMYLNHYKKTTYYEESSEKIESSRHQLNTVFHNKNVGMALVRTDGTFEKANSIFRKMLGYEIGDIAQSNLNDIFGDLNLFGDLAYRAKGYARDEKEIITINGKKLWVDYSITFADTSDTENKQLGLITIADISKTKNIERKFENQFEMYDKINQLGTKVNSILDINELLDALTKGMINIFETEKCSVWIADENQEYIECRKIFGSTEEKKILEGYKLQKGIGFAGWSMKHQKPILLANAQKDRRYFDHLPTKTGYKFKSLLVYPLIADDKFIGVIQLLDRRPNLFESRHTVLAKSLANTAVSGIKNALLHQEIKEQLQRLKEVKDELVISERKWKSFLQNSPNIIVILDQDGIINYINRAPRWLENQNLVGEPMTKYVAEIYSRKMQRIFKKVSADERSRVTAIKLVSPTNNPVWYLCSVAVLKTDGVNDTYIVNASDITKIKVSEQRMILAQKLAEESQKIKDDFVSNLSHEIRTPVTGILGMTEILEDSGLTHNQKNQLQSLKKSAQNLLAIINDVLDFSHLYFGKIRRNDQEFIFEELITNVSSSFGIAANNQGNEIQVKIDDAIPQKLCFDSQKLNQILTNLVGNAIKFTANGKVSIDAQLISKTHDHARIQISITDTGKGIDQKDLQKIFDAFTQLDSDKHGTGLGLAIVKKIVEILGGDLKVVSKLGEGTNFVLTFEMKICDVSSQKSENDKKIDLAGKKVLLVEAPSQNCHLEIKKHSSVL